MARAGTKCCAHTVCLVMGWDRETIKFLAESLCDLPGNSKILWLDKLAVKCLRISSCVDENLHGSLP